MAGSVFGQVYGWTSTNSLAMPEPGEHLLRIISPTLLELTLITTKKDESAPMDQWNFVGPNFSLNLPAATEFKVSSDDEEIAVKRVGFKRRPLYAPLKKRDLRVLSELYIELAEPLKDQAKVEVTNPSGRLWKDPIRFQAAVDPLRFSPAIHVNEVGYQPDFPKKAMVGYYLGTLGELEIPGGGAFNLVDVLNDKVVFEGKLRLRADRGFAYSPTPYQKVFEADFSKFNTPGVYRLSVPGMGASYPFRIDPGSVAAFARTYALGLYHQRCGTNNVLPYTRFTHEACHTAPAEVPDLRFKRAQEVITEVSGDAKQMPRHTAPQLKNTETSLYPFIRKGKIDVSGGHHDAGDYSKYTINSAGLIHALVFAADNFEGAGALDNLGFPESGDGKSDLLQEAKWEADFLAKMQDDDGGFYFLVYPKERRYEDNVLPDKGDPQIVWPKNTAASAAATAALAEIGSSPLFKKQFPEAAELFMTKALRGWDFLQRAIERHGKDGSYQKLTHYGNEFLHDDELAWAAASLFAATGKKEFQTKLMEWFNPESPDTRRWSWWPMFEGYGCAARTYLFAARNGRLKPAGMDAGFLTRCESLIHLTAQNHARFSRETAYGTSFPDPNKANKNAGWYFSSERAFDMTVAYQLRKEEPLREAIMANLNYEAGCNPVNVAYITGLGERRQREIVHQYAQNDHRVLPPSGIPIGNIQAGFAYLYPYKKELGEIPYPPDGAEREPYPFYDRWGDSFNTSTEFVVVDQARSLASLAFWMAQTPALKQPWRAAGGAIVGLPKSSPSGKTVTASLKAEGVDLSQARVTWEARGQEPVIATQFAFAPDQVGECWVEAEALLSDGRRVFATNSFLVSASLETPVNAVRSAPLKPGPQTAALFHFDNSLRNSAGSDSEAKISGKAAFDNGNLSWMKERAGAALRFKDLGDKAVAQVDLRPFSSKSEITIEAMVFLNEFKGYNKGNAKILSLSENWNSSLEFIENKYDGPMFKGGTLFSVGKPAITNALTPGVWHHLALTVSTRGYEAKVDGKSIGATNKTEFANWGKKPATLEIGNFDGYIDEVAVTVSSGGASVGAVANATSPAPPPARVAVPAKTLVERLNEPVQPKRPLNPKGPNAFFLGVDEETRGKWNSEYGKSGCKFPFGGENASQFSTPAAVYTWKESTPDARALIKPGAGEGVAACWYNEKEFSVSVRPANDNPQQLSLYFLDWDEVGRSQAIDILAGSELLDTTRVENFNQGKYFTWIISGPVEVRLRKESGPNAVLMGIFLDPLSDEGRKVAGQSAE